MPRSNNKFSLSNNNTKIVFNQYSIKLSYTELILQLNLEFFYFYLIIYLVTPPNLLAPPQPPPPPATLKPRNPHPQFFTLKSAFLNQKSTNHHHPPHYTLSRWTLERVWAPEKSGNPRWQAQPQQAILEPTTTKHTGQQRREHTRKSFYNMLSNFMASF